MTRGTVQVLTIDQWKRLDFQVQDAILRNIKLKDRLHVWIKEQRAKQMKPTDDPVYRPCSGCEQTGWVLKEPRYPGIHPSQVIHQCMLRIFWEMQGKEAVQKHEARLLLIFDFGTALHHMMQGYGEKGAWGPHYKKEVPINVDTQELAKHLMLEGSADAENILTLDIEGHPFYEVGLIHEYKSINSENYSKLTVRPKPDHKLQASVYAAVLDRPIVVYLYMNKNDSSISDFPVPFDESLWSSLYTKCATLVDHYDRYAEDERRGALPVLPPATVSFACKDCQYSDSCSAYAESKRGR